MISVEQDLMSTANKDYITLLHQDQERSTKNRNPAVMFSAGFCSFLLFWTI
ncbi:hypothetical protein SBF1_560023 [Candidatus Desulfosporosinus infrequens]|uniref:Uncharacterized protein n=1 Tax=Candidatus Desulfosporosinus infrequens TaxID=2043169 RepID=A0A2U3LJF5_9FIRM|nr:hypothetical protein SBF1_560023 [Candidatus Desulfosporosinus infrequens]